VRLSYRQGRKNIAMKKEIIINSTNEETRIAILEDEQLVELFVERPEAERMVGDIYKGKVSRVLPGMQAAFIDIGLSQNAFLHFSDISDATNQFLVELDDEEEDGEHPVKNIPLRPQHARQVARNLKKNQDIIVQIMKEPIGSKGPRVTSDISIPGRFAVLVPNQNYVGISKKISHPKEKKRLRTIARQALPKNFGMIIRTQADGKSEKVIMTDINGLLKIWEKIDTQIKEVEAPFLVYKDFGMASSIIRDLFTSDVDHVIIDSRKQMREISSYVKDVAPQLKHKIEYYSKRLPIFEHFKIEDEIIRTMESKVWLKNGAYIVIQQTEAMVAIDVNSGKFIGKKDHELNALKINMEAAREVARQSRLRDLGGIIVIDFIDMENNENRLKLYHELKREFHKDRSITKIEEISRFGIVEMTRQRIRPGVLHTLHEECPNCHGTGLIPSLPTIVAAIERWVQKYRASRGDRRITIRVRSDIFDYLSNGRFSRRLQLMWKYWMNINVVIDDTLNWREFKMYDRKNEHEITMS
jgi:ribonuclease G